MATREFLRIASHFLFKHLSAESVNRRKKGTSKMRSVIRDASISYLATAFGIKACQLGKKVKFFRVTELITKMIEAREERSLERIKRTLASLDLLILDELGGNAKSS